MFQNNCLKVLEKVKKVFSTMHKKYNSLFGRRFKRLCGVYRLAISRKFALHTEIMRSQKSGVGAALISVSTRDTFES